MGLERRTGYNVRGIKNSNVVTAVSTDFKRQVLSYSITIRI
jgi:hypothetical protein